MAEKTTKLIRVIVKASRIVIPRSIATNGGANMSNLLSSMMRTILIGVR